MTPILGITASSITSSTIGDFESIATVIVGSGGSSQIDFTSIPSTYQHLQLRAFYVCSNTAGTIRFRVGGTSISTATVYNTHQFQGNGSSASGFEFGGSASDSTFLPLDSQTTYGFAAIFDFLDYANTNKNKTVRHLSGGDNNGSGFANLGSSLWAQTTAIGCIRIYPQAGTFNQNSHFALYGIKG